ncbi:MAG: DUF2125 domain-containing protein, partial [Rhizobiaceae bacterium]|nr:DUF2125 domain-containing protein [Rhizobiaceae bacterium]
MVPSSASETGRASRAFLWIAVVAMVLAAGLSLAWYVMANRLDAAVKTAIETAGGQGVRLDCRNQAVFGYPFRLGLRCDALQIEASESNFAARGGELRTAAQIYRPTRIVAELDGPFALSAEGTPPFRIDWTLAQASADFWTEGLDRLSVVLDEPGIAAGPVGAIQPLARSERIEFHARRRDQALDIAFLDRAIKAADPALAALPAFDISGDLTIEDAADWLSGERSGETLGQALAGKSGAVRSLRIALSSARDGTGTSLPGSGEISGLFSVAEGGRLS